jgi:hypothetical protein
LAPLLVLLLAELSEHQVDITHTILGVFQICVKEFQGKNSGTIIQMIMKSKNSFFQFNMRGVIGALCILTPVIFTTISLALFPFVKVLPYLHKFVFETRVGFFAFFYIALITIAFSSISKADRNAWFGQHMSGIRDKLLMLVGVSLLIICSAGLAANFMGAMVWAFPGSQKTQRYQVLSVEREGAKYKSIKLELKTVVTAEIFEVSLAKKYFGYLPKINSGDVLSTVEKRNLFGSYIDSLSVESKNQIAP